MEIIPMYITNITEEKAHLSGLIKKVLERKSLSANPANMSPN
jgi:hypothetical protein